jgi:hypothetical protein
MALQWISCFREMKTGLVIKEIDSDVSVRGMLLTVNPRPVARFVRHTETGAAPGGGV